MKNALPRNWLTDLLLAGVLLTRLPLPQLPPDAFARGARAVWAYPVAGTLLGLVAGAVGQTLLALGLPAVFAAGGVLAVLMLLSGAMHEDGLGDTADGFWGGQTAARRLEIMKDSHIGTYGLLALGVTTGLRWSAYAALIPLGIWPVVAAAALSRAAMPCVMAGLPHARDTGLSLSVGQPDGRAAVTALVLAVVIGLASVGPAAVGGLLSALTATLGVGLIAHRKIAGQTGDVLGAVQQVSELAVLTSFVLILT
ncbi:adenosylcobinamide-GDP ribazoletransferase [uncultured Roseobacter sp.]|uniref:adenosylcobinamide-GDP ribazoletransferase n=1 Tax=uncultured Roseobacter sp. TaxID=114847 RepID=UPI002632226F|nr:adenosylcobinamide-GDP ribazoletransferase [uncultured Roseobacter sp.]